MFDKLNIYIYNIRLTLRKYFFCMSKWFEWHCGKIRHSNMTKKVKRHSISVDEINSVYIYIYIYMCVCVYVYVQYINMNTGNLLCHTEVLSFVMLWTTIIYSYKDNMQILLLCLYKYRWCSLVHFFETPFIHPTVMKSF